VIPAARLGHVDQVALASDRPALDVHVYRGIEIRIHPTRGFDIGSAWFRGVPLAWISDAGEGGAAGRDWRRAWGGGLVTTCGLDNVGAPSEGVGLHGTYTFLPARDVEVFQLEDHVTCSAWIDEPRGLLVERLVSTRLGRGRVELIDRVENVSAGALEAPLLYHVNIGWPVWDEGARMQSNAEEIVPRDDDAAPHSPADPPRPVTAPERVWEHVGATRAGVVNDALGLSVTVRSNLPRLWQWVDPSPGVYAFALEPANCSVLGRAHDRAEGRLPFLEPGEKRETRLTIEAEVA
jgi:Domain of unknown function (DUF4432)